MIDTYGTRGGKNFRLSQREIQEMRKNMQKVPIIKMQSDIYHQNETKNVDEILDLIPETNQITNTKYAESKKTYLQKIIEKIKSFINKYTKKG